MSGLCGLEAAQHISFSCCVTNYAMVFPVVVYGGESWTIKKAERQSIDAFELWCWRRLLRGPWTARRSNQSTLKEISPEYSPEGLMLKLKLRAGRLHVGRQALHPLQLVTPCAQ